MGQHKYNPTAIAAKEGRIPPKPPKPSKAERDRAIYEALARAMWERLLKKEQASDKVQDAETESGEVAER